MKKNLLSFFALISVLLVQVTAAAPAVCAQQPEWPREALRYELEGVTTLEFKLDRRGNVRNPSVQKSSSWKLLDDAAMSSLSKCKFRDIDPAGDFSINYEWRLDGGASVHPIPVPGSCTPSDRFQGFKGLDQNPSDGSGILVRFIVKDGHAAEIVPEVKGQAPELIGAAIEFVKTCGFTIATGFESARGHAMFGRIILK